MCVEMLSPLGVGFIKLVGVVFGVWRQGQDASVGFHLKMESEKCRFFFF
jgi:hypothetical protein